MKIGEIIRKIRLEQGMTLEEVALSAGTFAGNLSRIERGKQQPSVELLEHIAHALQTTVAGIYNYGQTTTVTAHTDQKENTTPHLIQEADGPEYANEVILFRRSFKELTTTNKLLAVEFVKLLNRLQREG